MEALILLVALVLIACLVLPIVAIVRTSKIRNLEARLTGVEAALMRMVRERAAAGVPTAPQSIPEPAPVAAAVSLPTEQPAPPPVAEPAPPMWQPAPAVTAPRENLEAIIGRRWLGLVAIVLIFVATVFFLKYAFENRWIGELGRVTLGVLAGLTLVWGGHNRHRKGWRYLSQILTGGGIGILYLSVYGAFAYYHLIDQRAAFVFLAIVVVQAHLLAMAYNARPVAVLALAGGFLVPMLLSTGRDQYSVLFTYIGVLDLGMLLLVIARGWRWIGSLAYIGTQVLFAAWYSEHYHPEKRTAALLFQAAIFLIFVCADLAPHIRRRAAGWEESIRLAVNPFVFYGICYALLSEEHHDWMAALALGMAVFYAALARGELILCREDRRMLLVTVGTALAFVTLAIPVQLDSNWITIAWAAEAVALLWVAFETAAPPLRLFSALVFALALFRFLFLDTPWMSRAPFTPVMNRHFLGTLALVTCLGAASYLCRRGGPALAVGLLAVGVFWLGSSVEAYTYFSARAGAAASLAIQDSYESARQLRWSGQLALSILWSMFAGLLTAAGFRSGLRALRVAGLVLFGITLVKAVLVDISELRQFYRIVALLVLGLFLLAVAWAYQRILRREQTG